MLNHGYNPASLNFHGFTYPNPPKATCIKIISLSLCLPQGLIREHEGSEERREPYFKYYLFLFSLFILGFLFPKLMNDKE